MAKVKATVGLSWDEQQIPRDSDNDGLADFWEITNGGTDKANSADDEEMAGIDQKGDGFTKEDEYKGYTVRGKHYRMDPTKKELFFNTSSTATEKDFARQGLTSLGLTVIEVPEDPTFLGGTIRTALQVAKDTYQSLNTDGDMVALNGTIHDVEVIFGVAPLDTGQGTATIYEEAIHNLWKQNGVEETVRKVFKWNQTTRAGEEELVAVFNNTDLDGDGALTSRINVFDLMAPAGSGNDAIDGKVHGTTETELRKRTSRHEAGHVIGIPHTPAGTSSVMRQGIGPGKIDDFDAQDKRQVKLK